MWVWEWQTKFYFIFISFRNPSLPILLQSLHIYKITFRLLLFLVFRIPDCGHHFHVSISFTFAPAESWSHSNLSSGDSLSKRGDFHFGRGPPWDYPELEWPIRANFQSIWMRCIWVDGGRTTPSKHAAKSRNKQLRVEFPGVRWKWRFLLSVNHQAKWYSPRQRLPRVECLWRLECDHKWRQPPHRWIPAISRSSKFLIDLN